LRVLHHCEQVTRNVSQTCRFFGISRSLFYIWRDRYRQDARRSGSSPFGQRNGEALPIPG